MININFNIFNLLHLNKIVLKFMVSLTKLLYHTTTNMSTIFYYYLYDYYFGLLFPSFPSPSPYTQFGVWFYFPKPEFVIVLILNIHIQSTVCVLCLFIFHRRVLSSAIDIYKE